MAQVPAQTLLPIRLCGGTALALLLAVAPAAAAWEPTKPVEIVVAAGAGGASDQMARMMQAAIQKNNLMKQPMVVSLKGGASGAEALMYMKSSDGDPNKVLIAYSLIYMLPLSAKIPFNWRELTPVSVMALDQFVLWDNTHAAVQERRRNSSTPPRPPTRRSRWAAPAPSARITCSPSSWRRRPAPSSPTCPTSRAARRRPSSSATTPQPTSTIRRRTSKSGAPARCARSACSTRSASTTRPRSPTTQSWNDIPTCKEEGLDVQYLMLRAMFLPGKVTPEQTAFYVDLFKKVAQTAEYKDYMEKQALKPIFLTGKDMLKFLEEDDALNKELMTEAGFVAK